MPRNRSYYDSDFLYVSRSPATGQFFSSGNVGTNLISGLYRIQSANYAKGVTRTDVNQFGELPRIDSIILESPTVNLDFQYLSNSFYNEKLVGFTVSSGALVSAISGILNKTEDEKNYFIRQTPEGSEVVAGAAPTNSTLGAIIGLGNMFISSYSAEGSVGNFATVSMAAEGLNWKVDSVTGAAGPSVLPEDGSAVTDWVYTIPAISNSHPGGLTISAIRPGDIVVDMDTYDGDEAGAKVSDLKIQSYNISFDLSRTPLQKLGSKYAFSREIDFPVTISTSLTADLGDLQSGNFVDKVNSDSTYDLNVKLYRPGATRNDLNVALAYFIKGVKLDSESFTSSIGDNKSVTLNFTNQIGGANSSNVGIYFSGLN
jgi:hypothetical protein